MTVRYQAGARQLRGFTLLELLVALTVFAILAALVWQGLAGLSAATEVQRQRADRFADLQRLVFTLDADLRQLVSRTGRDQANRLLPALAGRADGWVGRRAQPVVSAGASGLLQVGWRRDGDALVREVWADADSDPAGPPLSAVRYPDIVAFTLRYRSAQTGWQTTWPVAVPPETLPTAIEYRLEHRKFGEIVRLVVL